mgnify:CR=1 FL=1
MIAISEQPSIKDLPNQLFDLIIIGGGITGAGIALDAASRGLKVALFEKLDFASGTSSRSTKLIHGGLRYLKQFDFKLVRDTGTERAIAYKNAPHLVIPEKMLMPIVEGGSYGKFMAGVGLTIYDWLANVKKSERRKMVNKKQALTIEPKLRQDILKGGGYYTEYRTDDARLTVEVIKTAVAQGAYCYNYTEVSDFLYENDQVIGVTVNQNDQLFAVKAKTVVNATGPWTDGLRKKDKSLQGKRLHLTKGVHLVVPKERFSVQDTIYFDVPGGRMIFVIPRGEITYIGTTDTNYKGELEEPTVTKEDVTYLLASVNSMFPSIKLEENDIISSWSGLRPLIHEEGKDPSEISRKDEVFESDSGLITIAGGKLTGYRLMAKKIVDKVCDRLGINETSKTKQLPIGGGNIAPELMTGFIEQAAIQFSVDKKKVSDLFYKYGVNATTVLENAQNSSLLEAEVDYTIQFEGAKKLVDYFIRRTGYMYFNPQRVSSELDIVADIFTKTFDWSDEQKNKEIKSIQHWLKRITNFI